MRIVAHSCSNTEIVCALGCGDLLVGVDDHSDHPAEVVRRVARVGPDLAVDVEAIRRLEPDLVLYSLTVPGHERALDALLAAGVNVVVLEPVSLDDVLANIGTVGAALGVPDRAAALVAGLRDEITAVPAREVRPRVLVEWWPKPVIVPGRRSWVTDLIDAAGGENPFAARDVKSTPITDDEARAAAPDAVVIAWCGVPTSHYRTSVVHRRAAWAGVPALTHDRVIPVPEAWLGRPGPRLVEGFGALRAVVDRVTGQS